MGLLPMLVFFGLIVYGFASALKKKPKTTQSPVRTESEKPIVASKQRILADPPPPDSDLPEEGESFYESAPSGMPYTGSLGAVAPEGTGLFDSELEMLEKLSTTEEKTCASVDEQPVFQTSEAARCIILGEILSTPKWKEVLQRNEFKK